MLQPPVLRRQLCIHKPAIRHVILMASQGASWKETRNYVASFKKIAGSQWPVLHSAYCQHRSRLFATF